MIAPLNLYYIWFFICCMTWHDKAKRFARSEAQRKDISRTRRRTILATSCLLRPTAVVRTAGGSGEGDYGGTRKVTMVVDACCALFCTILHCCALLCAMCSAYYTLLCTVHMMMLGYNVPCTVQSLQSPTWRNLGRLLEADM